MISTAYIHYISDDIFQEIKYTTIDELHEKLKTILVLYDADIHIQLLIDTNILNNFDIIDLLVLSKIIDNNSITVIFSDKKNLYCLENKNRKYILDDRNDNYSKLLKRLFYIIKIVMILLKKFHYIYSINIKLILIEINI